MIKGFAHEGLYTTDFEGMTKFYCDGLGFEHAFDYDTPEGEKWLRFIRVAPGQYIELIYRDVEPLSGHYAHLSLEVDDYKEHVKQLEAKGIPLFREPTQGAPKNWTWWVKDPDGNKIEFMQVMPESLQAQLEEGRK